MKIGIIGCGTIAHSHVRIIRQLMKNAHLLLCDLNKLNADKLATEFGAQGIYTSVDELFSKETPDTSHILTPPTTHAKLAEKAILSGCHVLIEKPATETLEEFNKISNLASKKNKILLVNYSTLGMPVVLKAREAIKSGKFGRLIAVHCNYAASWPDNTIPYGDPNHWSYFLRGGTLQNWADHPASLVLDVMDPIEDHKIFCSSRNILPYNCPDLLHVVAKSKDQIGSFTLSLGHGSTDIRAYFFLEGCSITIDIRRMLISYTKGKGLQNFFKRALSGILDGYSLAGGTIKNALKLITGKLKREPGIINVISNFYKAISSGEELLVRRDTVAAVTKLLEDVWNEIDYKPM